MTDRRFDQIWTSVFALDLVLRERVDNWGHWRRTGLHRLKDWLEASTHAPTRLMLPGRARRLVWAQLKEELLR